MVCEDGRGNDDPYVIPKCTYPGSRNSFRKLKFLCAYFLDSRFIHAGMTITSSVPSVPSEDPLFRLTR